MGDNSFGKKFRITSFGESHGKVVGVVIDGVPAGFKFDLSYIQSELNKRKPGQSNFTSTRKEHDEVEVLSGIFKERTTGAPICLIIKNKDVDSKKYEESKNLLRPSHIDYVIRKKFGEFADRGGFFGKCLHFFDVRARDERIAFAGEDDGAHCAIRTHFREGIL